MNRKTWQNAVIVIAALVMAFNKYIPEMGGLNHTAISTICIFAASMTLLILFDNTWPLLAAIAAYAVAGVYPINTAIEKSFGHHLFLFVLLNTVMISVLRDCGLLNRIAIYLISRPFARKSAWHFILGLYVGEVILGYFMDCTAHMVLFLGLTGQIFETLEIKRTSRLASLILMGELFLCAVSYTASPIGHALSIMSLGLFEELQPINYVQYLLVGTVLAVSAIAAYMLLLRYVFRLDVSKIEKFDVDSLRTDMGAMSRQEKISGSIFVAVVILWILPGLTQNLLPQVYQVLNRLTAVFPVLVGVLMLCIITVDKKPIMSYSSRLKTDASWATCHTIALAMLNSSALTNPEAGITAFLSARLGPMLSSMPTIAFVVAICFACTAIATVSSPTVGLMLTGTVTYTLISGGVIRGVNAGTMTILLTMCASFVFATPCSTYSALLYGSGWEDKKSHMLYGVGLSALGCLLTCTLAYFAATFIIP